MAETGPSARPWPATGCSSFAWKRESKFITATPSSGNSISHSSARRSSSTGVREKFHNKTVKDVPRHFVNHVPGLDTLLGRGFSSVTAIAFHFGNPPINQALFSLTPHPVLTNLDLYPKENKCRQHITSIVSIFCPHPLWNERSRS